MPPKSTFDRLPEDIRAEYDRFLADARWTLDEFVAYAESKGHPVSRSAAHRRQQDLSEAIGDLKEKREIAMAFAAELGTTPEGEMGRFLVEMVQSLLFRRASALRGSEDEKIETKEIMLLARSLRDLASSGKAITDAKAAARRELAAEQKAKLEAVERDLAGTGAAGQPADLKAVLARIRTEVYGIAEAA